MKLTIKLFIFVILFFASASVVSAYKPQYFGYFWVSQLYRDNNFKEVSGYTNIGFVDNTWVGKDSVSDIATADIDYLNKLNSVGMKGIVNLTRIFWTPSQTLPYLLKSNWESRFNEYWRLIYPHLGKIAAFYPIDEANSNASIMNYNQVVNLLKINTDSTSYKTPILTVLTPSGVLSLKNGTLGLNNEPTWIGFDEYGCWGTDCFGGMSIEDKLNVLITKSRSFTNGKVVLIPQAFTNDPNQVNQNFLINRANQYYELCKKYPECIGLFPFLWDDFGSTKRGISVMPVVENRYIQIGQDIFGRTTCAQTCGSGSIGTCLEFTNSCSNTLCGGGSSSPNACVQRRSVIALPPYFVTDCGTNLCTCYTCTNISTSCSYGCNLSSCACNLSPSSTPSPTSTHTPTPTNPLPTNTPTPYYNYTPTNTPTPVPIPGDANGDGRVDGIDYVIWINHYNQPGSGPSGGDFNSDTRVDGLDYIIWLNNFVS